MSSPSEFGDLEFPFTDAELNSIPGLSTRDTNDNVRTPAGASTVSMGSNASSVAVPRLPDMVSDADFDNPLFLAELEVSLTQFERNHAHAACKYGLIGGCFDIHLTM